MKQNRNFRAFRWLMGSLCVWMLCAWVAQQPTPVNKGVSKASPSQSPGGTTVDTADTNAVRLDPETGLAVDNNLMLVKGQCTVCHSSKLILQSHFDREKWAERIRWMQRTQKLWDLGAAEPAILTYLTKYYGPTKTPFDGRRLPLGAPTWHRGAGR